MKKILLLFIVLQVSLFASIGKITAVQGEVFITSGSEKVAAKSGSILNEKDIVNTGDNSKALLLFNDKTSISIGKNSEFSIEDYLYDDKVASNNKANFKFNVGVFRTITGAIGKLNKEKFKIKTKSASIGIRGTVFLVEMKQDTLRVGVEDGRVFVVPLDKNLPTIDIDKNEVLTYNDETKEFKVVPLSQWEEATQLKEELEENKDDTERLEEVDVDKLKEELEKWIDVWTNEDPSDPNDPELFPEPPVIDDPVNKEDITQNSNPTVSADGISVNEGVTGTIQVTASDIDGDTLTYSISGSPSNGTATINSETGLISYTSNSISADITDSITVLVSDGKGGQVQITIPIIVYNIVTSSSEATSEVSNLTEGLNAITGEVLGHPGLDADLEEALDGDNIQFGFVSNGSIDESTGVFVSGPVTPTAQVEAYISQGKIANYTGSIASIIDDSPVYEGSVSLNVNFGTQNVTGTLSVDPNNRNWNANINSGSVSPYGFSSDNITGTTKSAGAITSGTLNGRFYGTDASKVGGSFKLNTSSESINGAFVGSE